MSNKQEVILQPAEIVDYPFLVKWGNQRGMRQQLLSKRKTNSLDQKSFIAKAANLKDYCAFVVLLRGDGKPTHAGLCEIYNIDYYNRTCFVNVHLEDKVNVLGVYGFKVLQLLLEHIYYRLGLYKVSVELLLEQNLELTLFKQHDFAIEVRKRKHAFVGGQYKTVVELSLLKPQFESKNG